MTFITSSDRFAIFGALGMAGSAISRALHRAGYSERSNPVVKSLIYSIRWRFSSGLLSNSRRW